MKNGRFKQNALSGLALRLNLGLLLRLFVIGNLVVVQFI